MSQDCLHAEIIAIGDELTSGQRLDTNSQWLSQQLGDLGIRTLFHTTVADDLDSNIEVFRTASGRVDIVLATGGLGPTADDLTRESMAKAMDVELQLDQISLDTIRNMFASRGRDMPERNRVQAMFPAGSRTIPNPNGTAPGVDFTTKDHRCRLFALPGVPAEMKEMWHQTVRARLLEDYEDRLNPVFHYSLKVFGTGESALEAMLPNLIQRGRVPTVGVTVSKATITLRTSAQAKNEEAFRQLIQPTLDVIHEKLGELVFGEEDDELQDAVHRLLTKRDQTVAAVEWGSAGIIAHWMSGLESFVGGISLNRFDDAQSFIIPTSNQAVSELSQPELAKMMAAMAREKTNADYGISVGPFPEQTEDHDAKVYLGIASDSKLEAISRRFVGHPAIQIPRVAKQALNELRLHLLES